jgi:predicted component of type VI protein secretion system
MPQNFRYEQLLQSIVEEEAALARLVNQEAMKTQKIAQNISGQFTPDEVIAFQRSLASVLYNIQKKEELLIKKMRLVFDAQKKCEDPYFQEPRID